MIDINQMMSEISSLVHGKYKIFLKLLSNCQMVHFLREILEQGQTVDNIGDHIENVAIDVDQAREELAKASSYQQKYRKKVFIIFIICLIVALIIAFSIYSKA